MSGIGGDSGKAVKPIALRFVWELAACPELKGIPISDMGGLRPGGTQWNSSCCEPTTFR